MLRQRFAMILAAFAAFFSPVLTMSSPAAAFTDNPTPIAFEVATIDQGSAGADQTMLTLRATTNLNLLHNITYQGTVPMVNISLVDRLATYHFAPASDTMLGSIDDSPAPLTVATAFDTGDPSAV